MEPLLPFRRTDGTRQRAEPTWRAVEADLATTFDAFLRRLASGG